MLYQEKFLINKLRVNFLEQYKQGCLIPYSVLNDFNPYYILIKIGNIWHNRSESPSNAVFLRLFEPPGLKK